MESFHNIFMECCFVSLMEKRKKRLVPSVLKYGFHGKKQKLLKMLLDIWLLSDFHLSSSLQDIFRKNFLTQTVLVLKKEEPCDVQFSAECLKKSVR